MVNAKPYQHSPFPHLNGPILGGNNPQPGNIANVPHQPALKGTNVGGNIVTRTFNSLFARFQQ